MAPIPGILGGMVGAATAANLQFVGGTTGTGATSSFSVTLSGALTGGIGTSPIVGDVVVVAVTQYGPNVNSDLSISGYTELCDLYSNNTYDTNLAVFYKRMTATPDTSFTIGSSYFNGSAPIAVVVHVWRGCNASNPIDVTTTTATGTGSAVPNPPSITPATGGAVILAVGGAASGASGFFSAPQLSNFVEENHITTFHAAVGIGSYRWQGGAFDPNAFTISAGSDGLSSWAAATMALRP